MGPRRARRRGIIAGAAIARSRSNNTKRENPQPASATQDLTKQLTELKAGRQWYTYPS